MGARKVEDETRNNEDEEAALGGHLERMNARATGKREEGDEGPVEIDVDDVEDREQEEEEERRAAESPRPSRTERRGSRFTTIQQERDQERERAIRAEAELDVLRRQPAAAPTTTEAKDEHKEQLEALNKKERSLLARWNAIPDKQRTAEMDEDFQREAEELRDQRFAVIARREAGGGQGMTPAQLRAANVDFYMRTNYPDVVATPQYAKWAHGRLIQLVAMGRVDDVDTLRQVMNETRVHFKLGTKPAPTERDRARTRGVSHGSGGGGQPARRVVPMTPATEKIAEAKYPHLPPKKAHETWAAKIGVKALQRQATRGA